MALDYQLLGTRITALRKRRKVTQQQFAEMIDKSTTFVSRLERGIKHPSLETLLLIAEVLDTTPNKLLEDSLLVTNEEDFADSTPYEHFVLSEMTHALRQILQKGEHIRHQNR